MQIGKTARALADFSKALKVALLIHRLELLNNFTYKYQDFFDKISVDFAEMFDRGLETENSF